HPDLADRVHHVLALRDQNIDLPQLRNDLFRLVSLPCHCSPPGCQRHTSSRTTSMGVDQLHAGERSGPSIRRCARWLGEDAFVPERDSWICRKPSRFILISWWLVKGHGRGQARIIVEVEARACPLRQLQNPWGCFRIYRPSSVRRFRPPKL